MEEQLEKFIAALTAYADDEYCRAVRMAHQHGACLGWEAKVKAGKFGLVEHDAHAKMNKHIGAHFGIYEAVKRARASLVQGTEATAGGGATPGVPAVDPAQAFTEPGERRWSRVLVVLSEAMERAVRAFDTGTADDYGKACIAFHDAVAAELDRITSGVTPVRWRTEAVSDCLTYIIVQRAPNLVPERKGGYRDSRHVEAMLRELYTADPNVTCIVIDLPVTSYPAHGREWLDMYGDRRRKPLPRPYGVKASDEAQRREELSRTGHGHVVPRVDGAKARCGGVMYCDKCKYEREYIAASRGVAPSDGSQR
jgi:hypothetical protein